jgi:hypothetical protein
MVTNDRASQRPAFMADQIDAELDAVGNLEFERRAKRAAVH